jgi:hypothetical protein
VIVHAMRSSRIGTFDNCSALQDGDDAGFADALPRQAQNEDVELCAGQRQCRARILRPDELVTVQPARSQPHADAVVHEHLQAVGAPVGGPALFAR